MDLAKQRHPQFVTDGDGNKIGVILSMGEYQELLDDLGDLAVAVERRDEPVVSHEDLVLELRRDGLLQD
jgi:hypothetical protein